MRRKQMSDSNKEKKKKLEMKEYYMLPCKCVMTCEKLNKEEYRWEMVIPRCVGSFGVKLSCISEKDPVAYNAKPLTKFEAAIEKLKG
jgi:hypothetical protein